MPADLARVKELFLAVLDLPPAERAAYLDASCAGAPELRQRLEAMLASHAHSGELLPRSAGAMLNAEDTEASATAAFAEHASGSVTQLPGATPGAEDLSFLKRSSNPNALGQLGHYEIRQVLGKGGFGVVLKGFDERLHRVVAIKVLAPAYAAHGAARKRFVREARAAAAVKNEHVVGIYEVQQDAEPPYLVMECIEGISLQDKIDRQGPLGLKEILRIGMQMAEGLAAAHKQGLVHRDIKPANILLENGVERVKITDFGLARAVDDASVTQSGTVAGTPMYMSPEQAEGLPIDHRSDLFSLGTVLYAMCTGHPPFRASGTHAVLKRVIEAAPRPIREINSDIPEWLCDIIARLHAKKPEDRFQTAKEVAELLGERLADVQAGREIGRAEDRKVAGEAPARAPITRPLTGHGSRTPTKHVLGGAIRWLARGVAAVAAVILLVWVIPNWWRGSGTIALQSNDLDAQVELIVTAQDGSSSNTLAANGDIELPAGFYYVETRCDSKHLIDLITITDWQFKKRTFPGGVDKEKMSIRVEKGQRTFIDVRVKPRDARTEPGWVQLFNGQDLTGWELPANAPEAWSVVGNEIIRKPSVFPNVLTTKRRDYVNFHLRAEAKVSDKGYGGIRLRLKDGGLPGYEVAINCTDSLPAKTGSLLRLPIEGKPWALVSLPSSSVPPDTWFTLEVVAEGPNLTVKINNVKTAEIKDALLHTGALGLASGNNTEIRFRKIEIKELPSAGVSPPAAKTDKERLLGTWKAVLLADNGSKLEKIPSEMSITFRFEDDMATLHIVGNEPVGKKTVLEQRIQGLVHLNDGKSPKQITIVHFGKEKTSALRGIYRLDQDRLEICADTTPATKYEYPTQFKTAPGSPLRHWVFERVNDPGWVKLFNGQDLAGWTGVTKDWKVQKEALVSTGAPALLRTEQSYHHFSLHFETWIEPNGGLPPLLDIWLHYRDDEPDKSVQQVLLQLFTDVGRGAPNSGTGNYRIFKNKRTQVNAKGDFTPPESLKPRQWNRVEITSKAGRIHISVNGKHAALFDAESTMAGYIGLRAHYAGEWRFRNIEIKDLSHVAEQKP